MRTGIFYCLTRLYSCSKAKQQELQPEPKQTNGFAETNSISLFYKHFVCEGFILNFASKLRILRKVLARSLRIIFLGCFINACFFVCPRITRILVYLKRRKYIYASYCLLEELKKSCGFQVIIKI